MYYYSFSTPFYNNFALSSYPSMQLGSYYTRSSMGGPHTLESRVPQIVWSRNLHQRYCFIEEVNENATRKYFTENIFVTAAKSEKIRDQWTSFIKGTYLWNFQVETTS